MLSVSVLVLLHTSVIVVAVVCLLAIAAVVTTPQVARMTAVIVTVSIEVVVAIVNAPRARMRTNRSLTPIICSANVLV